MNNYTGQRGELNFEDDFINQLLQVGWEEVIKNPTVKDLEENFRKIVNKRNIDRLHNVPLSDDEFNNLMTEISSKKNPVEVNHFLMSRNDNPICINRDDGTIVYINLFNEPEIGAGTSRYQIAEQVIFGTDTMLNDRRGDLTLLINGLPLIHIELKASGVPAIEAANQIQKYIKEGVFTGLFNTTQVFFAITPEDSLYFSNYGKWENANDTFYFRWKDENNKEIKDWRNLCIGKSQILSIPEAHKLIGYYVVADTGKGVLKVLRSYQYYAIKEIVTKVEEHNWNSIAPLGGYIWCTTGGGKTLTSFKTGQLIIDRGKADKIVFVVDRVELYTQTVAEYESFARECDKINNPTTSEDLYNKLKSDDQSDALIVTSIQKLSKIKEEVGVNSAEMKKILSKRIVFIVDEAQRSQFGKMHQRIKGTFKGALFFGFTGTPILENETYSTNSLFGDCLAEYTIADGIKDGNVLGFAPKQIKTYDDETLRNKIALKECGVATKEEAKVSDKLWSKYKDIHKRPMADEVINGESVNGIESMLPKNFYDNKGHRGEVVKSILDDFSIVSVGEKGTCFHGILATDSIQEAIEYYHLLKDTDLKVTALFDPNIDNSGENQLIKQDALVEIFDDYNKMFFGTTKFTLKNAKDFKTDVINRLSHKQGYKYIKNESDKQLDLVIVVDQLLTGFDSQYVIVLYLDKILDKHNLIQAISRTNRVYDKIEKPFGLFRFYRKPYTMQKNLEDALRLYCKGDNFTDVCISEIDTLIKNMNRTFNEIKSIFEQDGIKDFIRKPKTKEGVNLFRKDFYELNKDIKAAKMQGCNVFDKESVRKALSDKQLEDITLNFTEDDFEVLSYRYEDVAGKKQERKNTPGKSHLIVQTSLSVMESEIIDSDYIEKMFKEVGPKLVSKDLKEEEKQKEIDTLMEQTAKLSEKDQLIAEEVLTDLKKGVTILDKDKTLRKYIAEYKEKKKEDKIKAFARDYGVDIDLLREIIVALDIKAKGRFDRLWETREIGVAEKTTGKNKPIAARNQTRMKLEELREEL